MYEYLLVFLLISVAFLLHEKDKQPWRFFHICLSALYLIVLAVWPKLFPKYNIFGLILLYLVIKYIFTRLRVSTKALTLCVFMVSAAAPVIISFWSPQKYIYLHRNYYGIYKVFASKGTLFLSHGIIIHGGQSLDKGNENEPLTYFSRSSGVGKVLGCEHCVFGRVGIIGLGTGTLAAYGRPGQEMDFFELDPDLLKVTGTCFTYLKNSKAKIKYLFGDARITIKNIPQQYYDVLIMDAFTGGNPPVHLLTMDAIREYRRILKPGGILLVNISNRYFEFTPILLENAKGSGAFFAHASLKQDNINPKLRWVSLTWNKETQEKLITLGWDDKGGKILPFLLPKMVRPWTDGYSNLLTILSPNALVSEIKDFRLFDW